MATMHAAVVTEFDEPPRYDEFPVPRPHGEHELLADVIAAGLHPRVRSGASGRHYSSTRRLPMIPGVDGVGRLPDGRLVYFVAEDDVLGTMAEKAVVDMRRAIVLPEAADALQIAASMNPAMSSWVALRTRAALAPGSSVLVLGATGNAGTAAVQMARLLGAGRVIGAGRDRQRLAALRGVGADEVVHLTDDADAEARALASAASDVDIVLDYLWAAPTERAIVAILTARQDRSRRLDWIQVGSVAGPTIVLPSSALRSANLYLLGAGQGAVSPQEYVAELPSLVEELQAGAIGIAPRPVRLADVQAAWNEHTEPGERIVLLP